MRRSSSLIGFHIRQEGLGDFLCIGTASILWRKGCHPLQILLTNLPQFEQGRRTGDMKHQLFVTAKRKVQSQSIVVSRLGRSLWYGRNNGLTHLVRHHIHFLQRVRVAGFVTHSRGSGLQGCSVFAQKQLQHVIHLLW